LLEGSRIEAAIQLNGQAWIKAQADAALSAPGRRNQLQEGVRHRGLGLGLKTLSPKVKSLAIDLVVPAKRGHIQTAAAMCLYQVLPISDSLFLGHG